MKCPKCNRSHGSNTIIDVVCKCGQKLTVIPRTPENRKEPLEREHLRKCLPICEQCEHYVDDRRGTGCGLLRKPCNIKVKLLNGDGCQGSPRRFWPAKCPKSTDTPPSDIVAVTSLGGDHERQSLCLDSWAARGLDVAVVNTGDEIQQHKRKYDAAVTHWFPAQKRSINQLSLVAKELNKPILLMNADIEIHGDVSQVQAKPNTLQMGIRFNYEHVKYDQAAREPWGFDAFVITPEMAEQLPYSPLEIGKPIWDYWLPLHFGRLGYRIDVIGERLFWHRSHPLRWSEDDWYRAAEWINSEYQIDFHMGLASDFRRSLPYPPPKPEE